VPQEEGDLPLGQVEDLVWHEPLVTAGTEEPEIVEPLRDRVPATVRHVERSRKAEAGAARCLVVVPHCSDAEVPGRIRHRLQVRLVDAGVAEWLVPHERTVSDEVTEHHNVLVDPVCAGV
jgi:hypothetical protein